MWPFKARASKDEEEEEEFGYEQWQAPHAQNHYQRTPYSQAPQIQAGFSSGGYGEYEEDCEEEEQSRGISVKAAIFLLAAILYIVYLVVGSFSTDYANGRGYIVSNSLRAERAYIADLRPYYNVIVRVPEGVDSLQKGNNNAIELQYQLQNLQKAVASFRTAEKAMHPPGPYAAYQKFLVSLAEKEAAWIQDNIAYTQDKKAERLGDLKRVEGEINYLIGQAKDQMKAIDERLVSNTKPAHHNEGGIS